MNLSHRGAERIGTAAILLIAVCGLVAFLAYQIRLLSFMEWGDESETIVAAKMIVAGHSLYGEVFNHHGPLTFLPGVITELVGGHSIAAHRIFIAMLQLASLVALVWSPMMRGVSKPVRLTYGLFVAVVYVAFLPSNYGHMYLYQVMCGLMISIALAGWVLPLLWNPERQPSNLVTVAFGFLIGSLPFLAVTYIPVTVALLIACSYRSNVRAIVSGCALALGFNLLFIILAGSLKGYVAYHLYMNLRILPSYNGDLGPLALVASAYKVATGDPANLFMLATIAASVTVLAARHSFLPWRPALVALGVGSLLVRGGGMHGLPYAYAALVFPLVFFAAIPKHIVVRSILITVFSLVLVVRLIIGAPGERETMRQQKVPTTSDFAVLARALTEPGDRVLAYSFQNLQYILADRLPASGYYFMLPWQQEYLGHPVLGITADPCADIARYKPKLIMADEWKVLGIHDWSQYGGCIVTVLERDYARIPGTPYHIRSDIAHEIGLSRTTDTQLSATAPLETGATLDVPDTVADGAAPRKLGVMFGTYARQNEGAVVLTTDNGDGKRIIGRLQLADLQDNQFAYFMVPPDTHGDLGLEIEQGGGVAVWQAVGPDGIAAPCTILVSSASKPALTPGCPVDMRVFTENQ
ncbi:TPA: hypothetical protein QEL76_003243 [Stenotrophomonas maltophilia]|nr:hypothetical protein [Stenotrophomonas maltophilia]